MTMRSYAIIILRWDNCMNFADNTKSCRQICMNILRVEMSH